MQLILVPHSSNQNSAKLWLCATGIDSAPADFPLTIEKVGVRTVFNNDWRPVEIGDFTGGALRTFVQTCTIEGLEAFTGYRVTAGGVPAMFSTLPSSLPRENSPFNVLLSSCFYIGDAGAAVIGSAIDHLPPWVKPHVKILCGDQVYLDVPEVTFLPLGGNALSRLFLGKYLRNWSDEAGYQVLLRTGSSYFSSDDHEFWNNHPNRAFHLPDTWKQGGRDRLNALGLQLFKAFQCADPAQAGRNQKFSVGRLSFLIADTRLNRKQGGREFMDPADLADVAAWVDGLSGPGVLVVGQPVFEKPAGFFARTFADRNLPDYDQYENLVVALSKSRHTVLVLTGDVHYSRIASAVFETGVRPEIIEVIASPSAVVKGAPGKFAAAPDRFPTNSISSVTAAHTTTLIEGSGRNNFATLQFFEVPPEVKVRIRHWYTDEGIVQSGPEVEKSLM